MGYALDFAKQWQEVGKTVLVGVLVVFLLDVLNWRANADWFENHIDFMSVQAMLLTGRAQNWWHQTATLVRFQRRVA